MFALEKRVWAPWSASSSQPHIGSSRPPDTLLSVCLLPSFWLDSLYSSTVLIVCIHSLAPPTTGGIVILQTISLALGVNLVFSSWIQFRQIGSHTSSSFISSESHISTKQPTALADVVYTAGEYIIIQPKGKDKKSKRPWSFFRYSVFRHDNVIYFCLFCLFFWVFSGPLKSSSPDIYIRLFSEAPAFKAQSLFVPLFKR